MRRLNFRWLLIAALTLPIMLSSALADSPEHRSAVKICKQRYKAAVKGAKYLKQRDREARIEEARRERANCVANAPR
jgi:hypothetical protein